MTAPLRVRRLTDHEGRTITQVVCRGAGRSEKSIVKWRRALVVQASAGGNTVPVIARLVATSEDPVREMIHRFNEHGLASLDPQWAGGRSRRITTDDENFIVETATARPEALGQPFTRWSLRKLAAYPADNPARVLTISVERLRQLLDAMTSRSSGPRPGRSPTIPTVTPSSTGSKRCSSSTRPRRGALNVLAALRSIRARRPDGQMI